MEPGKKKSVWTPRQACTAAMIDLQLGSLTWKSSLTMSQVQFCKVHSTVHYVDLNNATFTGSRHGDVFGPTCTYMLHKFENAQPPFFFFFRTNGAKKTKRQDSYAFLQRETSWLHGQGAVLPTRESCWKHLRQLHVKRVAGEMSITERWKQTL